MKVIKDPVHGDVEVEGWLLPLLDAPALQRLRYIRQLGFSYLVYPGAHHTRFEHALGTMHLAAALSRQLGLSPGESRLVTASALLHDIGHGPFSHAIEPAAEEYTGCDHQEVREILEDDAMAGILDSIGLDPAAIEGMISGRHRLAGVLSGDLDVDRMDYLLRDAHYTGVPYGTVDAHRLIRGMTFAEGTLVLRESAIHAAESLLIARTLMRPAVYFHHVSRIAEAMFLHAVRAHCRSITSADRPRLFRMDDAACMETLIRSPDPVARRLIDAIYHRRLYKRAVYAGRDQVHPAGLRNCMAYPEGRRIADEIAYACRIPPEEVLLQIPQFPSEMSIGIAVRNRHAVVGLAEISPLVTALNETRRGHWRLGVYAPAHAIPAVREAAVEILNIRPATTQETLPF